MSYYLTRNYSWMSCYFDVLRLGDGRGSSASIPGFLPGRVDGNRNASVCSTTSKTTSGDDTPANPGSMTATQLESPCSIASDGSTNWNGIPRVRRKWVDAVEGMKHAIGK